MKVHIIRTLRKRLLACRGNVRRLMKVMRRYFFIISVGTSAKVVVCEERHDQGLPLRMYQFHEFRKRFQTFQLEHELPNGKTKFIDLGAFYTQSAKRREYEGRLVFRPTGSPFPWDEQRDYNQWHGLAVEPTKGDWSRLQAHIYNNLCQGNDEYHDYLLNWMAHLVQRPGELPSVAVCLHGGQGTGKGTFFQCLAALFPREHVMHVTKREHLVGRFNAHLSAKVFVFADEATFAGDKSIIGELNAIITERLRGVEYKGIDVTMEDNCVHLLIASNNDWFLHAARDARRYFVLDVSSAKAQNTTYFDAIMQQQSGGGTAALLYDLLKRDLSSFNPFNRPETEALRRQKQYSMESHEAWWREILTNAKLPTRERKEDSAFTVTVWREWSNVGPVVKRDLHDHYLEWMKRMGRSHPLTEELFSQWLHRLYGHGISHRDRICGKRERTYSLPTLAESRTRFDPHDTWGTPENVVPIRRKKS